MATPGPSPSQMSDLSEQKVTWFSELGDWRKIDHTTQSRPGQPFRTFKSSHLGKPEELKSLKPRFSARQPGFAKPRQPIESYKLHVSLVVDKEGNISFLSSPELKRYKCDILSSARDKLLRYIEEIGTEELEDIETQTVFQQATPEARQTPTAAPRMGSVSYPWSHASKKQCTELSSFVSEGEDAASDTHPSDCIDSLDLPHHQTLLSIRADDHDGWTAWMTEAFQALSQMNCRTVAKEWIKAIHPKKQSTHPYNGNMPRHLEPDSNRTRPIWWPEDVPHKEPDHLDKQNRTRLLVRILMYSPRFEVSSGQPPNELSAQDLLAVLKNKKDDLHLQKVWHIIEEIVDLRTLLENFEDGGYDPETKFSVKDWSESNRSVSTSKTKDDKQKAEKATAEKSVHPRQQDDFTTLAATTAFGNTKDTPNQLPEVVHSLRPFDVSRDKRQPRFSQDHSTPRMLSRSEPIQIDLSDMPHGMDFSIGEETLPDRGPLQHYWPASITPGSSTSVSFSEHAPGHDLIGVMPLSMFSHDMPTRSPTQHSGFNVMTPLSSLHGHEQFHDDYKANVSMSNMYGATSAGAFDYPVSYRCSMQRPMFADTSGAYYHPL